MDYTVKDVQQMCNYFNHVGKIAKRIWVETRISQSCQRIQKLKDSDKVMWEYLVENTDPRYVCFEMDVYWCTKGGKDPVAYLKNILNVSRCYILRMNL